jgi:beta-phosphoglucomutase-like phosphatase (HAD superfamily)
MIKIDKNIKGLIFDCDGTLIDTMPLHTESWDAAFTQLGHKLPEDFIDRYKGIPSADIVRKYNLEFNTDLDPDGTAALKNSIVENKIPFAKPIQQIVNIAIEYKGKLPMAVASGGNRTNVDASLESIGLNELFDAVVTANDDVKPKPFPDIFLEAAKRIGVEPENCLVFEDGDMGIEAAEKAGMPVIDVRKYI